MSLENTIFANGLISISDTHGNSNTDLNVLSYAKNNDLAVLYGGDTINDYNLLGKANELGFKTQKQHFIQYFKEEAISGSNADINTIDLDSYLLAENLQGFNGTIDDLINDVPQEYKSRAKEELESKINYIQSNEFNEKINLLQKNFISDKKDDVIKDSKNIRALYEVFIDEEAKRFASNMNNYSDVNVLFNLGNHENSVFVDHLRHYLNNKEQIIDLNSIEGYVRIKDDSGEEIKLAGLTNCSQFMPYLSEIFAPEELSSLYSHMALDENQRETLLSGDIKNQNLEGKLGREYSRIKKGEDNNKLDILVSHGQIGKPILSKDGKVGYEVPYLLDAAVLANEAQIYVEGHIHGSFQKDKMVRTAGDKAAIIKKNKGKINVEDWVLVDEEFDGNHSNEIPYTNDYLLNRMKEVLNHYEDIENLQKAS